MCEKSKSTTFSYYEKSLQLKAGKNPNLLFKAKQIKAFQWNPCCNLYVFNLVNKHHFIASQCSSRYYTCATLSESKIISVTEETLNKMKKWKYGVTTALGWGSENQNVMKFMFHHVARSLSELGQICLFKLVAQGIMWADVPDLAIAVVSQHWLVTADVLACGRNFVILSIAIFFNSSWLVVYLNKLVELKVM